jgi:hypothetical protein
MWFNGAGQPMIAEGTVAVALFAAGQFKIASVGGRFYIGLDEAQHMARFSANGGWHLVPGPSDVVIGPTTVLAPGITTGFLDIGTISANAPTALPSESIGACGAIINTALGPWLCQAGTPSTWYRIGRTGKGADVASAATVVVTAADRTAFDYFHLTGSTAVDFLSFAAADVYGQIRDGEPVTFYCTAGTTFNHNTAAPPANASPFRLVGGVNAVLAAGAKICFRRDAALGQWVEMFRSGA